MAGRIPELSDFSFSKEQTRPLEHAARRSEEVLRCRNPSCRTASFTNLSDSVHCWSRGLRLGAKSHSCRVCHRFYRHSTHIHCFDDHSSWFAGYFYLFTYPGLQAHGASTISIQIHAVAGIPPLCDLLGECLLWMYPLPLLDSICNTIAYPSSQKRKP